MIRRDGKTRPSRIWGELLGIQRVDRALLILALVSAVASIQCGAPTEAPQPVGGGRDYVLSFERFVEEVAPVLDGEGCSAGGDCHGGGIRGSYLLTPLEEKDLELDFLQTGLQVFPFALSESPILTKPLAVAAGGERHGHEPFASTDDPGYRAIYEWVYGGVFR